MHFGCKRFVTELVKSNYKQFSISFLNNMFSQVILLFFYRQLFASISRMTFQAFEDMIQSENIVNSHMIL